MKLSDYVEHLRRCAANLNEHAEILRDEARVLTREADDMEHVARDLFVRALIEALKRWLTRT